MARIRSIKPEICCSEQVAECSPTARLLFVYSWLHFDDAGNHPAKVMQLKAECFPLDNFDRHTMEGLVQELIQVGLFVEYVGSDGAIYWHITGWRHQKIDKPKPKWPEFAEQSPNGRRTVDEQSPTSRDRTGPDRTGKDRTGEGGEGTGPDRSRPDRTGEDRTGVDRTGPETPARPLGKFPKKVRDAWNRWEAYVFQRDGTRNPIVLDQHLMDLQRHLDAHGPDYVIEAIERSIGKQSKNRIYWDELPVVGGKQRAKIPEDF